MSAIDEAEKWLNDFGDLDSHTHIIKNLLEELSKRDKVIEAVFSKLKDTTELNMNNYTEDEVVNLNDAAIDIFLDLKLFLSQLEDKP